MFQVNTGIPVSLQMRSAKDEFGNPLEMAPCLAIHPVRPDGSPMMDADSRSPRPDMYPGKETNKQTNKQTNTQRSNATFLAFQEKKAAETLCCLSHFCRASVCATRYCTRLTPEMPIDVLTLSCEVLFLTSTFCLVAGMQFGHHALNGASMHVPAPCMPHHPLNPVDEMEHRYVHQAYSPSRLENTLVQLKFL